MRIGSISTNKTLAQAGAKQESCTLKFNKTRGMIYDCKLVPLVDEKQSYIAAVLPTPQNAIDLQKSGAVNVSKEELTSRKPFITKACLPYVDIPQVKCFAVPQRYQKNQLAQHLIGYIDSSSGSGITGIEKAYDDIISKNSQESKITYLLDGLGEPLLGAQPKVSLANVRLDGIALTIDKRIQQACEESGSRHIKKGAIVVMEPSSGKIKALASFPSYNANDIANAVKDTKNSPLLNRCFNAYPVGSIFKLVTAAEALTEGISPKTEYDCHGEITLGDVSFGCHDKMGHGNLDMKSAMAASCNPYFINLSTMLKKQNFLNMASDLGFGKSVACFDKSGIKNASGNLPSLESLSTQGAVANLGFGQGELTATPVQIAQLLSCIVNGGNMQAPSIIEGYTKNGKTLLPNENADSFPVKAMAPSVANLLKEYMVCAVMDTPNQNAKPQYVLAGGKTGTAQTGQYITSKEGEKTELLQGWFAGFYPTQNPQYVIAVTVEDSTSGNKDASPVFAEIVDTLTLPPTFPAK